MRATTKALAKIPKNIMATKMRRISALLNRLMCLFAALTATPALAAGSIPIALQQNVNVNGQPLAGCLLYIYQAGTVATPQNAFQDFGLSSTLPNPLSCDQTGRLPMFYLADGAVHVRLTDASGVVVFDYPTMQVLGPSSGGGGGGSVDPTSVMATGDIKFRPTSEVLTGWVRINGQTIGSVTSGSTGRANADTQNLFVYLWNNCTDTHCAVVGGRGASGLADFNANKQITLPDWRGRIPVGLDDMGNIAAGRLLAGNVTSGGGDGVATPAATGGEANHTLLAAEMPAHTHTATSVVTDPGHTHTLNNAVSLLRTTGGTAVAANGFGTAVTITENSATTGVTVATTNTSAGGGGSHNVMQPFMLGTWHIKL